MLGLMKSHGCVALLNIQHMNLLLNALVYANELIQTPCKKVNVKNLWRIIFRAFRRMCGVFHIFPTFYSIMGVPRYLLGFF